MRSRSRKSFLLIPAIFSCLVGCMSSKVVTKESIVGEYGIQVRKGQDFADTLRWEFKSGGEFRLYDPQTKQEVFRGRWSFDDDHVVAQIVQVGGMPAKEAKRTPDTRLLWTFATKVAEDGLELHAADESMVLKRAEAK